MNIYFVQLSTRSLFLLRLVYTHRHVENDTFYQSALSLFDFGAITTFTFERKLTKYSRIGCSLTTVLPNGALNIKFRYIVSHHDTILNRVYLDTILSQ